MGENKEVDKLDYNKTINLPKTDFPMRASLPQREPEAVKHWDETHLYDEMLRHRADRPQYILHDGPPYASGDIHMGTALNKVLKDIVTRYKNLRGFRADYVPGWDMHGLPIELRALREMGVEATDISPLKVRENCRNFAMRFMDNHRRQFKRLGVLGDFENPYLTLAPEFEARQIEVFGKMAERGYFYKGLKPVYWCSECGTALAEAEIEYAEDPCDSIYVKFRVSDDRGVLTGMGIDPAKTFFVIWTTTTWTLPGNLAICLGPKYDYVVVEAGEENYVVARELLEPTMQAAGITDYRVLGELTGSDCEYMKCRHPFLDRDSLVIVGDHVTLDSGTGCVHTAPGHGVEDYEACKNYPELPIVVPVDAKGYLTQEAGMFAGLTTADANKKIAAHLKETGALFAIQSIIHQYPHCWRCHEPILYRATEQWFCSVEAFKNETIEAINRVQWIPEWGRDRITNMVRDRSDWCISRQRAWGLPIPVFYCEKCGCEHITPESIRAVADLFREKGSDAWFAMDASEILPAGTVCAKCGGTTFTKEKDIMDVWFDSGSTHAAVLDERDNLRWPADLYLEGADQYRGWFQSSLLTAIGMGKGEAPYKTVVTHGWVVDGEGRKMSKSLGNGMDPNEIVEKYGADILRLWVASSDYHADIRVSQDILKQISESYRKIRNTMRFLLGNLDGFNPETDKVAFDQLPELDRWALVRLDEVLKKSIAAYDAFDFHIVYHTVHNFCTIDMSSFYLDVVKDRLYAEAANGEARRAAQTVLYEAARVLTMLIAPILSFTAEEVWSFLPADSAYEAGSVMFSELPATGRFTAENGFMERWSRIHAIRDDVNKALELARGQKLIGKSLEASVTLHCEGELYDFVSAQANWKELLIVSGVEIACGGKGDFGGDVEGLSVCVGRAKGEKCERCWIYSEDVGSHELHPTLCARCASVVEAAN